MRYIFKNCLETARNFLLSKDAAKDIFEKQKAIIKKLHIKSNELSKSYIYRT